MKFIQNKKLFTVVESQNLYAEVLYTFKAVGNQELCLERGALVEVLRREPGPWWWGRVKHDAVLSSQMSEQREGWFPKDFVRVSFFFFFFCIQVVQLFCFIKSRCL